jgi:hypothetical protein
VDRNHILKGPDDCRIACRNPTPEWSTSSEFPFWPPARNFPLDYMVIGNKNGESEKLLSMEKDLLPERYAFWKKLRKDAPKWGVGNKKDEL